MTSKARPWAPMPAGSAELAAPLDEYERGLFTLRSDFPTGALTIERADPHVLASAALLHAVNDQTQRAETAGNWLDGDLLCVYATNRTVTYRIGPKHPHLPAYCLDMVDTPEAKGDKP